MYKTFMTYQRALFKFKSGEAAGWEEAECIFHICFPFVLTGVQCNNKQVTTYFTST